ncbi:MAG: hypothetical protein H6Q52_2535 [Deltaproteobacteria bacterium]|nr:hypothetical protein [Deltaproteobacteria bacterium]
MNTCQGLLHCPLLLLRGHSISVINACMEKKIDTPQRKNVRFKHMFLKR